MNTKIAALLLLALTATACQGPDPVRLRAERASYFHAVRCADGWFHGLRFTADDERVVRAALADWDNALSADEALAGWTVPK